MMDTILNLGLNDDAVEGLIKRTETHALHGIHTAVSFKCTVMWF